MSGKRTAEVEEYEEEILASKRIKGNPDREGYEDYHDDDELNAEDIIAQINADQVDPAETKFDAEDLQRLLKNLEKHLTKNQELRARFAKNPEKFMDSEVDLDEDITKLNILSTEINLWPHFLKSGAVAHLIILISHENIDLSIDVINLIRELFDYELDQESYDMVTQLYDVFIESKLVEALVSNLSRFNEEKPEESEAVHKSLNIIEHILELKPLMAQYMVDNTKILPWLIQRLSPKYPFDDNKLYASEILAILIQGSRENQFSFGKLGGIDNLLSTLAEYRKTDPKVEEEREMIENIFDVLCASLLVRDNQDLFAKGEGVELMIRMLKEKNYCSRSAIKALSYALDKHSVNCKIFVEGLGLKFIFPTFMGKGIKEKNAENRTKMYEDLIAVLFSLFVYTSGVSLDRVVNKFKENDAEKVDRLIEFYHQYLNQLKNIANRANDEEFQGMDPEEVEDRLTIEKYKVLFVLHKIAYMLAYLITTEDKEVNWYNTGLINLGCGICKQKVESS